MIGVVQSEIVNKIPVTRPIVSDRPTIGIIESISTGFDAVLHQPWLMAIPLLLDLFLWLGPQIQAGPLYDKIAPNIPALSTSAGADPDTQLAIQQAGQMVQDFFTKFNLFSWLSAGPFGVPSLSAGADPAAKNVFGVAPQAWQVGDPGTYLLVVIGLGVAGLFVAGLFWSMASNRILGKAFDLPNLFRSGVVLWINLMIFMALLIGAALVLMVPLTLVMALLGALSVGLASLAPAVALSLAMWALFYVAFTIHGVALYGLPLRKSARLSALVARVYFAPTMGLIGLSLAIYLGIGLIWDNFPIDSWLWLVAIAGHALVATGLFLASFVYYQNRSSILLDVMKAAQPPTTN